MLNMTFQVNEEKDDSINVGMIGNGFENQSFIYIPTSHLTSEC